jgi:hypothetical protein
VNRLHFVMCQRSLHSHGDKQPGWSPTNQLHDTNPANFLEARFWITTAGPSNHSEVRTLVPQYGYWSPIELRSTVIDAIGILYNVSAPPLTFDLDAGPSGSA